ncbi:MAG: helix-turn-helix transcriptional regulator [Geitlerinemataceae cyanobacterium]
MPKFAQIANPNTEWLVRGSAIDPRLLHADADDEILVYPDDWGYRQTIPLQDGLSLNIIDYTLDRDTIFQRQRGENSLAFEFQLTDTGIAQSCWKHSFDEHVLWLTPGKQRVFELEVVLKPPFVTRHLQPILERLSERARSAFRALLEHACNPHQRLSHLTEIELFERFLYQRSRGIDDRTLAEQFPTSLLGNGIELSNAMKLTLTPTIQHLAAQILDCPYQGATRRRYLTEKALALLSQSIETIHRPLLPSPDLDAIYEAAKILRDNVTKPPSIEQLARRVYANRFKLYQGFHAVYGMTPLDYLRYYRLVMAHQLLYTSELSIGEVVAAVGYSNRSRFAAMFKQLSGMNPKTFQLQLQQLDRAAS